VLLAGAAVIGAGIALQVPARRAALPQLVPEPLLQRANAVDAATQTLGRGVGAGIGGVVVALVGARWLFAVDLLTYAVSLATLLWIRLPPVAAREAAAASRAATAGLRSALARVRREAAEGVREVARRPWAAAVMVQGTLQVFCLFAPAYALVPIVTQQRYGPGAYGWIMAASAAGSLLGSAIGARSRPRRPGLVAMNALAPTLALPACLAVDVPVWGFCLASLGAWTGIGWFFVLWFSALQRDFPPQVQGRVFSLESLATYGLEPVALAAAPPLAAAVGMTPLAVTAVVVMLASNYLILLVPGVVRFASTASREAPAPS
jgi:hypothetical protein